MGLASLPPLARPIRLSLPAGREMGPGGNRKGLWVSLGRWKAALAGLRPSIGGTAVVVQIEERYGCTPLPDLG